MIDAISLAAEVDALHRQAIKILTPCHDGHLVWRHFGGPLGAPRLLLAHGGSGSWTHWFRNIAYLQERYQVTTIDLPGLGDSAALPKGYSASDAVDAVHAGLTDAMGEDPFHLCAFSWGCALTSQLSVRCASQLQSMMLIGPASLGDIERRGGMLPLIKRTPDMSAEEVFATNRENLVRLMFCKQSQIDDMAIYLQTQNTVRARFNSPQFAKTGLTLEGIGAHKVPLHVVYGEQDAPALPDVPGKESLFRGVRADVHFSVVPECGHWLQYECANEFHDLITDWVSRNG